MVEIDILGGYFMAEITLVRHGQASFGEDNYDLLSPSGHLQARWLGEQYKALNTSFDHIVTGTMVRHQETADNIINGFDSFIPITKNIGLNEYDFKGLLAVLKQDFSKSWLETNNKERDYYFNIKLALTYWMSGEIESDNHDTWISFKERVLSAFYSICSLNQKRILLISSGGPIATVIAEILKLDCQRYRDISLQIKNTSTSKILFSQNNFTLDSYNDVSHLKVPNKMSSITFT